MKKFISLMMALILVCSLLPMAASADTDASASSVLTQQEARKGKDNKDKGDKSKDDKDKGDKSKDDKDKADTHHKGKHNKKAAKVPHNHEYNGYGSNPTYHWLQCGCGCKINVEPHVDPLETDDDYCFCGYHFSDNADLVTLWVKDCPPIKNFNKNKTEYALNSYTYKDVKEIQISTNTFDSEATVELPDDLTLKDGENKFEIKVISENKKVTKIYTVIVTKDAKK